MKRIHIWVSGTVQGVFFRHSAKVAAEALGLVGIARNLPDGRVEIIAEGPGEKLEELCAWARRGPAGARVEGTAVAWEKPTGEYSSFRIARDYTRLSRGEY
ncbi:MAG: acylphosphatase [Candidatus Aureabacteria bacterium]|nr:acylphosphatase [Candidatus Auribacterota bacterium]